jgi:L-amino acid N-acyltransferase YncA
MEIRKLQKSDAAGLLEYFRDLVNSDPERVERLDDVEKLNLKSEEQWIAERLENEEKGELAVLCADEGGKIIALGEVEKQKRWIERHIAEIRFGVLPGNDEAALRLINALIESVEKNGVEVLIYFHLATQKRGLSIMKQAGFQEVGCIKGYYKRGEEYIDRIYLSKSIFAKVEP